jgi:chloride channel protein, CIC family
VPAGTRWFSHQPNVPGRGIVASYSPRFWGLVVALGLGTGVAGAILMEIFKLVEHASWSYHSGTYVAAVRAAPAWRHLAILAAAAVVVSFGVLVLRRLPSSGAGEVSESVWLAQGRVSFVPSIARALVSIVTVGMGVSLGREAAPQLAGAATASRLADWTSLPVWQRRLLVACGAGAGMAAVYNVPLGGALFALEVLIGTLSLPLVLPALLTSVIATSVAWITLGTHPTYSVPAYGVRASQLAWAALMGPLSGMVLVLELTRHTDALTAPTLLAVAEATVIARVLGAPSIYSARLQPGGKSDGAPVSGPEAADRASGAEAAPFSEPE